MLNKLAASELVLNDDGSVYHLNLLPEDIAGKIMLVGDPDRVPKVSKYFDTIEVKKNKREFYTHTGTLRGERITVMSTGIGTENIDIVMNELDALVNIDLKHKEFKSDHTALELFRMGTCGSVNPDVEVDNMLVTQNVVGLDGLLHFYQDYEFENEFSRNFMEKFPYEKIKPMLYFSDWSEEMGEYYKDAKYHGNTATFPGFYAPQGRQLRLKAIDDQFLETLNDILEELEKPGRDPRSKVETFEFNAAVKTIGDLNEGMVLPGIVTNITNFGCFVDVGIKENGLVHISELANRFVSNPTEVVSLHQYVTVKVLSIDKERKRVALSMKDIEG